MEREVILRRLARFGRAYLYFLFLCTASTFLAFALLEWVPGVREHVHPHIIQYYALRERYIPDDKLIYVPREPDTVRETDTRGDLFSMKYGVESPLRHFHSTYEGGFRTNSAPGPPWDVLVIGDSYIGMGEDDAGTLSERLRSVSGLATFNLGRACYGPHQYLELLRRHGPGSGARYAVFCFFDGNDINDLRRYLDWQAGLGDYRDMDPSRKNFLARYAQVMEDAGRTLERWFRHKRYALTVEPPHPGDVHPDLAFVAVGEQIVPMRFVYWPHTRTVEQRLAAQEWGVMRELLGEFRDLSRSYGMVPVVLFIPSKLEVYGAQATAESGSNFRRMWQERVGFVHGSEQVMARLTAELGIELVDLVPRFLAGAARGEILYYPFDTHWGPEGRQVAAELLAAHLARAAPLSPPAVAGGPPAAAPAER